MGESLHDKNDGIIFDFGTGLCLTEREPRGTDFIVVLRRVYCIENRFVQMKWQSTFKTTMYFFGCTFQKKNSINKQITNQLAEIIFRSLARFNDTQDAEKNSQSGRIA